MGSSGILWCRAEARWGLRAYTISVPHELGDRERLRLTALLAGDGPLKGLGKELTPAEPPARRGSIRLRGRCLFTTDLEEVRATIQAYADRAREEVNAEIAEELRHVKPSGRPA